MLLGFDMTFLWTAVLMALPYIIGGGFFTALMWWLSKDSSAVFKANYLGLAIQACRFVETEFENNPNQTIAKADLALKTFIDLYTANQNAAPSVALKAWFNIVKEEVLVDLAKAQLVNAPSAPAVATPVVPVAVPVPTAVATTPSK